MGYWKLFPKRSAFSIYDCELSITITVDNWLGSSRFLFEMEDVYFMAMIHLNEIYGLQYDNSFKSL